MRLTVNGRARELATEPFESLATTLRERLHLTGTKVACERGECGSCTVLIDGEPVYSCIALSAAYEGRNITTIEGLAAPGELHPVQQAFVNRSALQCGICIPGHVMAACALLEKNPNPTEDEIRASADSVYCRCTGYVRILEAYHEAITLAAKATKR